LKYGSEFALKVEPLEPHIVVAFNVVAGVAPIENLVSSVSCGSDGFKAVVSVLQNIVTAPPLV
jgi:hypothetical protein